MRFVLGLMLVVVMVAGVAHAAEGDIRVALISGGHDFEKIDFLTLFRSLSGITFRLLEQKDDDSAFLENIDDFKYDVIVLYNMGQNISDQRKANLIKLLDRGVGLVVLHHAIASFNDWPEYWNIIGCHYYLKPCEEKGKEHPQSAWKDDVEFTVKVEDKEHPVTKGINDFKLKDETYNLFDVAADNHVLLTTDEPTSQKTIAWTRTYKNANVCFIQMGHGSDTYFTKEYRQLVSQSIKWAFKK